METSGLDGVLVRRRFRGPQDSANGGYLAGLLADRLGTETTRVTLKSPPPLDRPLGAHPLEHDGLTLLHAGTVVAEAVPSVIDIAPPPPVSVEEARRAAASYPGFAQHAFPECFVCGPRRGGRDGLRIFPGRVEGRSIVAAPWTPDPSLARDGDVAPEFVWAALDCPGAWALLASTAPPEHPIVLGELTATVTGAVSPGRPYAVSGWLIGSEGRKHTCGSALYDAEGCALAVAKATWITIKQPTP